LLLTIKETEQSMSILGELAKVMKDNPQITKLRIEGHTDNTGTRRRNTKLSQQRAEAVAKWLSDHEVDKARLTAIGYADTRPVTDNETPEHRAINRRTEFHLQEVDGKPVSDENAVTGK
jgi:outer membrane protein OmpA-like peptidoglycan-associated protein